MYYDRPLKVPVYLFFKDLSAQETEIAVKHMTATKLKRLDWPGVTFHETAKKFASRGYDHILGSFPQTIDNDLLLRLANSHLAGEAGSAILSPHPHLLRNVSRVVKSPDDYQALFDKFLSCCTDESVCFSLKTANSPGFWGLGETVHFDPWRIAENVITVGHGEECNADLNLADIQKVLNNLFVHA
jgi:hypothetical protein